MREKNANVRHRERERERERLTDTNRNKQKLTETNRHTQTLTDTNIPKSGSLICSLKIQSRVFPLISFVTKNRIKNFQTDTPLIEQKPIENTE